MRILLVEDDPYQMNLFRIIYETSGHDVTTATCAQAQRLDWSTYCMVQVDLLMPDASMCGGELIRWAADKWGRRMPRVVLYSAVSPAQQRLICPDLPEWVRVEQKAGMASLQTQLASFTDTDAP